MKHYVIGFVFNNSKNRVLLIRKEKPEWMRGRWNGIGGKVEEDDQNPLSAMYRESNEETGHIYNWQHRITFVCPSGTVFVYSAVVNTYHIPFNQEEKELLQVWDLKSLPESIIPLLSFPST